VFPYTVLFISARLTRRPRVKSHSDCARRHSSVCSVHAHVCSGTIADIIPISEVARLEGA
jgi:hypothetical protein